MNERAKSLADECFDVMPDSTDLERFAELIVFECVKLAVFNSDSATARAIKEHFGIE